MPIATKPFTKTNKQHEAIALLKSDARHILLYGGSRSGKTLLLIYALVVRARKVKSRHLILRLHFNHVKTSVWHDTLPKVLDWVHRDDDGDPIPFKKNDTDFFIQFDNGSEIWIGGLDDKKRTEKVLGTEYSTILFNECSQFTYDSIGIALSRLAENAGLVNKAYYDCNPPHRQHWSHQVFIEGIEPKSKEALAKPERYACMLMNPCDNLENLPVDFIEMLEGLSRRQRERFLLGLWQDIGENALWKYDDILRESSPPDMERIVVAIDPAVTTSDDADETGIIVAGKCGNRFYVLEDISGRHKPLPWANIAVHAYFHWHADRIIGEVNNGGDMIEATIRQVNQSVSYKEVRATRGKVVRAEPIAALYEQGRGYHVGHFAELEDQLTTPIAELENDDRLDAMVWAATELMLEDHEVSVGSFEWPSGVE